MPDMPGPDSSVDTPFAESLSFAPPESTRPVPAAGEWPPILVTPGRGGAAFGNGASVERMTGYPIQLAKVQRPPLRDETLARDRLLDWLDVKVHNRVVFVIADAGYGKTTLLADFSRRTRL